MTYRKGFRMIGPIEAHKIIKQNKGKVPGSIDMIFIGISSFVFFFVIMLLFNLINEIVTSSLIVKLIFVFGIALVMEFPIFYLWTLYKINRYNLKLSDSVN
jgi:hypothetical protein